MEKVISGFSAGFNRNNRRKSGGGVIFKTKRGRGGLRGQLAKTLEDKQGPQHDDDTEILSERGTLSTGDVSCGYSVGSDSNHLLRNSSDNNGTYSGLNSLRSVRFAPKKQRVDIPSFKYMTPQDREALWYSKDELIVNRIRARESVKTCSRSVELVKEVADFEKAFHKARFLSNTMNEDETECLLRDEASLSKLVKSFEALLSVPPSEEVECQQRSSWTTSNRGEEPKQKDETDESSNVCSRVHARGLEEHLCNRLTKTQQELASEIRQVVIAMSRDFKNSTADLEDLALEYKNLSRAQLIWARFLAKVDSMHASRPQ